MFARKAEAGSIDGRWIQPLDTSTREPAPGDGQPSRTAVPDKVMKSVGCDPEYYD